MLKIENVEVVGWEAAIRGMRNPKNSWEKSDSSVVDGHSFFVGDNDFALMRTLANAGTDHGKFMRFITTLLRRCIGGRNLTLTRLVLLLILVLRCIRLQRRSLREMILATSISSTL